MVMRCSFTLDPELLEALDAFARKGSIGRNEAILELIEAGFASLEAGEEFEIKKQRSFEEYATIRKDVEEMKGLVQNMRDELRLVHHTIESDYCKEARGVPYQRRSLWDYMKRRD
ncbi:ribbon-helix-helix protein, CopG family [Methanofollis aquaemaris]|uniref:Ribbon-helix-helix protein, CopG family n=1 Tax=Methanofollis aquaemaris TaxID=126734 RepID=A0A8A3S4G5_9EURY|nr:type II secretion system protein E [Methanofollis aquaemaris]QSZ66759.1 ribbon-helix-helix protein, CopG family [Methanofollis aquaemaris]